MPDGEHSHPGLEEAVAGLETALGQLATVTTGAIAALEQEVGELKARVTLLEGADPDPDPDPDPGPDPGPGPQPPDDAIQVDPGDNIISAINSAAAAGRDVWLVSGGADHRLIGTLDGLPNVAILSDGAVLRGSGPGGHHLVASGGPRLFQGLDIVEFGPHHPTDQNGSVIIGSTRTLRDCKLRRSNNTGLRGGSGWLVERVHFADMGRYAFAGGPGENVPDGTPPFVIRDCSGERLGTDSVEGATRTPDSNRGTCKIARTRFVKVFGFFGRDVYQGIWYDIANSDGEVWDLDFDGVDRAGLNLEAGYDTFVGGRIKIRNAGRIKKQSEPAGYPAPSAISISLTGGVDLVDVDIDQSRNGVGLLNPTQHEQLDNVKNNLARMGVADIRISGRIGSSMSELAIGYAGRAHLDHPIRKPTGIDLSGITLAPGAKVDTSW